MHEYFALDNKLKLAALAHRHDDVGGLSSLLGTAAGRRAQLREKLREHEPTAHMK
jgi:hypothetical protein